MSGQKRETRLPAIHVFVFSKRKASRGSPGQARWWRLSRGGAL